MKPSCGSCNDTGLNSKGVLCHPCWVNGRQPLRDRLISSLQKLFDAEWEKGKLPDRRDVVDVVRWAFNPPVLYAAGYRQKDGSMGMFAGPDPDISKILSVEPEEDKPAYIVCIIEMVKGESHIERIARWRDGKWYRK